MKILIITYYIIFYIFYYYTINNNRYPNRIIPDNYFITITINSTFILIILIILNKYKSHIFKNFLLIPNIPLIIGNLLLVDTIFYWVHYITHRIPFLKKFIHDLHHEITLLMPLDFLYIDIFEFFTYVPLYTIVPLSTMKYLDYIIYLIIFILHHIYAHCNTKTKFILPFFINSKYHSYHHTIGKGNYAIFFPLWDNYMKTRIKKSKKSKKSKNPKNPKKSN